jgi:23S rRNA (adenine2503-C2)-methyltransferase
VPSRYDLDAHDLTGSLPDEPRYRIDQIWDGLYRRLTPLEEISNLPAALRQSLSETMPLALREVTRSVSDGGDTTKWLWALDDGARVETVLMHYEARSTVCVSSQAGCAMGCTFCATGQAGFERHLTTGEIVEQVVRAAQHSPSRVSNVVFMGMGEPMANYDATWAAVERLHGAVGISARHLTISTVGHVPGIRRMATEGLPVNLAVSLHAADDDLRDELIPLNRRWPLAELIDACVEHFDRTGRRISFEWALMADINDRPGDARALAALARSLPLPAHVNLIPLNPTPGWPTVGTDAAGVTRFRDQLGDLGVNATIRQNRGTEIDAACGQLRANHAVAVAEPTRRA